MKRTFILVLLIVVAHPIAAQQSWFFPAQPHGGISQDNLPGFERFIPIVSASQHPTSLKWPLDRQLGDGVFLSNYVDDDQGTTTMTDYMGGHDHLYDDHRGTDIAITNFRLMDRGVKILSPAAGTILRTTYNFGDRNTTTPYPDGGNGIAIRHQDGSESYYWHIRTNSAMVEPGELVVAGQPLAFVGSSGWTPIPHLHFELSGAKDPWQGTYNTTPSLWEDQPPYVGDAPLWIMDQGVFTLSAVGGSTSGITDWALKERISEPAMISDSESEVYAWVHVQGNIGDQFLTELIRPDQTMAASEITGISKKTRYGWFAFQFPLPGERPAGDWILRTSSNGSVLKETSFEIGSETRYPPRFRPVSGRSVRMGGGTFSENLSAVPFGNTATYQLIGAPSNVSLDESTITISGNSDQPFRSLFFEVVATDQFALSDTMRYHLVDPTKPINPVTSTTNEAPWEDVPNSFNLLPGHPNPATDHHIIQFDLVKPTSVKLNVFDALGRNVKEVDLGWLSGGLASYQLDTDALPPGFYVYQVMTQSQSVNQQFVLVN